MTPVRLFVEPPARGAWNMAFDEALLDDAADRGLASLRWYAWSEPTLSLGYFQRYDERLAHAPSRDVPCVRRLSGGGALLHDRELTYSLALPAGFPAARDAPKLYGLVHGAFIEALRAFGVAAAMHGQCQVEDSLATEPIHLDDDEPPGEEPFLCFARRTACDVMTTSPAAGSSESVKLVGSAQRRRRGAVLQHGAVLLAASQAAPELAGLQEAAPRFASLNLQQQLSERLAAAVEADFRLAEPEKSLIAAAERLERDRYGRAEWTRRR
jgi:lipoate-protein ligase A